MGNPVFCTVEKSALNLFGKIFFFLIYSLSTQNIVAKDLLFKEASIPFFIKNRANYWEKKGDQKELVSQINFSKKVFLDSHLFFDQPETPALKLEKIFGKDIKMKRLN